MFDFALGQPKVEMVTVTRSFHLFGNSKRKLHDNGWTISGSAKVALIRSISSTNLADQDL